MHLTVLRIISSITMLGLHGWPKLNKFNMMVHSFPDPVGLGSSFTLSFAIFAEFFCCILLIAGCLTRLATIPLFITMFVAAFIFHANDPIGKIELPLLYMSIYITIFFAGPGRFSLRIPLNRIKNKHLKWFLS